MELMRTRAHDRSRKAGSRDGDRCHLAFRTENQLLDSTVQAVTLDDHVGDDMRYRLQGHERFAELLPRLNVIKRQGTYALDGSRHRRCSADQFPGSECYRQVRRTSS